MADDFDHTLSLFTLTSPEFPFTPSRIKKIHDRRAQLDGQLFIDYMLSQAGIAEPTKVFPPKDEKEFKALLQAVWESDWGVDTQPSQDTQAWIHSHSPTRTHYDLTTRIKRSCIVYYLLAWWGDDRHLTYSNDQRISGQFAELTHAHFLLDIGNAAEATSLLCTPLITPDVGLSQKIFKALRVATDANPDVLVLRYARMAKPVLAPEDVLFLYTAALARVNFVEAWVSIREHDEFQRNELMGVIFDAVLSPRPVKTALRLLSTIPLQPLERVFLHQYTTSPPEHIPEPSLAALQSLVILRLSHEGDYTTAVKLNKEYAQYADKLLNMHPSVSESKGRKKKTDGKEKIPHASDSALDNKRTGLMLAQKAEEWRETLRESVALLPLEHRRILEGKLYESSLGPASSFAQPFTTANVGNTSVSNINIDMSWEDIDTNDQSTPPRTIPTAATTSRSPLPPTTPARPPKSTTSTPIQTQTLGKVLKPPAPRRSDNWLTPFRTPMTRANEDLLRGLGERSLAPPPSTGRAKANAFAQLEELLAAQGADHLLDDLKKGGAKQDNVVGDIVMGDGDETESAEDIASAEEDESFLLKERRNPLQPIASSLLAIQKAQQRRNEQLQAEQKAQQRAVEESMERRARLERNRKSLGEGSSFTSDGGVGGKRKRDPDDVMRREDEEGDEDLSRSARRRTLGSSTGPGSGLGGALGDSGGLGGSGGGGGGGRSFEMALSTHRLRVPTMKPGHSSESSAKEPPTSISPAHHASEHLKPGDLKLSDLQVKKSSNTSSQAGTVEELEGSNRGPSPSPEPTEAGNEEGETADEDERVMPGAFVHDDDASTTTRKTRRTTKKPVAAVGSKSTRSKTKKPPSAASQPPPSSGTRKTRSGRTTGEMAVPSAIPEDAPVSTAEEDTPSRPKRGTRKTTSEAKAALRVVTSAAGGSAMEGIESPVDGGRRSRRLMGSAPEIAVASATRSEVTGTRRTRRTQG